MSGAAHDLDGESRPVLPRGVRLQFDQARTSWVLLAPERVFMLDDIAAEVLQLCDGRTIGELVAALGEKFDAPGGEIHGDVIAMLKDLAAKGAVDV